MFIPSKRWLHKPLTPPNYANIGVFVSVMKHKYYSVLAGDLLFVFYGPSRLFHFKPIQS